MNSRVKNLEKITKKVLSLISQWEVHNGPYFYAGETYADRVEEQENNFHGGYVVCMCVSHLGGVCGIVCVCVYVCVCVCV